MPVRKPRRRKAAGPVVTSGVATKRNSGVGRRAGRGKLGGGILKATPTKRAGKPRAGNMDRVNIGPGGTQPKLGVTPTAPPKPKKKSAPPKRRTKKKAY